MNRIAQYERIFRSTSFITDFFPEKGGRIVDSLFHTVLGNNLLLKYFKLQIKREIKKVKSFNRFLVLADLNIGDAIIATCGVSSLRKVFPNSEIDFVIKKSTKDLIYGNPDVSNLFPVYNGSHVPTENDLLEISNLVNSKQYDLIINFSPMIAKKIFNKNNVINYAIMAVEFIRNEKSKDIINNVNVQAYKFIINAFRNFIPQNYDDDFAGAKIYLPESAVENAYIFLSNQNISHNVPIIMFNTDASAKYTRMPFNLQLSLLKKLSGLHCTILLGAGHEEKFIEQRLINSLSAYNGNKIAIVPSSLKLDTYTALIDLSDIYITGDTGPLHIAAARKYLRSTGKSLRNKTAVFSIFGSTPSRIYGYDSKIKNFFAANQDAPSRAFIAEVPCRNISCINKMAKACKEIRCFHSLNLNEIVSEAAAYFSSIKSFHLQEENHIFAK